MNIRFLADADPDFAIVLGVRRREPSIDFLSANDAGLEGLPDSEVLELAVAEGRILVSHDTSTIPVHFVGRSRLDLQNPGVLLAFQSAAIGEIIEAILTIWSASGAEEWAGLIHYLPSLSRHSFR